MSTPFAEGDTTAETLRFVKGRVDEINQFGRRHWNRMLAVASRLRRGHGVPEAEYGDEDAANDALDKLC